MQTVTTFAITAIDAVAELDHMFEKITWKVDKGLEKEIVLEIQQDTEAIEELVSVLHSIVRQNYKVLHILELTQNNTNK